MDVTNDGRLRKACDEDEVPVLWGLEVLAQVVEAGGLPVKAAIELAKRMAACNRRSGGGSAGGLLGRRGAARVAVSLRGG